MPWLLERVISCDFEMDSHAKMIYGSVVLDA